MNFTAPIIKYIVLCVCGVKTLFTGNILDSLCNRSRNANKIAAAFALRVVFKYIPFADCNRCMYVLLRLISFG